MSLKNFKTYQLSLEFYWLCENHKCARHLRDQLLRAAASITLNLAEGSAKPTARDRKSLLLYCTWFSSRMPGDHRSITARKPLAACEVGRSTWLSFVSTLPLTSLSANRKRCRAPGLRTPDRGHLPELGAKYPAKNRRTLHKL